MPFFSQTDFAKMIGKSNAFVSTYIKRGKIIKSGDVIDTKVQQNIDILMKYGVDVVSINGVVSNQPGKERNVKVEKPQPIQQNEKERRIVAPEPPPNTGGQYQLDLDKKEAELEFKLVQTRIKLIEEAKLRGELVPVDEVSKLISMLSRSIIISYKESMDKFLIELSHRTKLTAKHSAEMKGQMIKLMNEAHDNAIDQAIKDLKSISPNVESDGHE